MARLFAIASTEASSTGALYRATLTTSSKVGAWVPSWTGSGLNTVSSGPRVGGLRTWFGWVVSQIRDGYGEQTVSPASSALGPAVSSRVRALDPCDPACFRLVKGCSATPARERATPQRGLRAPAVPVCPEPYAEREFAGTPHRCASSNNPDVIESATPTIVRARAPDRSGGV